MNFPFCSWFHSYGLFSPKPGNFLFGWLVVHYLVVYNERRQLYHDSLFTIANYNNAPLFVIRKQWVRMQGGMQGGTLSILSFLLGYCNHKIMTFRDQECYSWEWKPVFGNIIGFLRLLRIGKDRKRTLFYLRTWSAPKDGPFLIGFTRWLPVSYNFLDSIVLCDVSNKLIVSDVHWN